MHTMGRMGFCPLYMKGLLIKNIAHKLSDKSDYSGIMKMQYTNEE